MLPRKLFVLAFLVFAVLSARAQKSDLDFLNHNQPVLDAHNCYPYEGQWTDRVKRALNSGFPVSIEQDLAWYIDPATGKGRVVVSHTPKPTGSEPTLRDYFFEQVRPVVERAIKENKRDQWPIIVLHFDFKDNQQAILEGVWQLLNEYKPWLSTATKTDDPHHLSPLDRKPILAITEDNDAQEKVFYDAVPTGSPLLLFGSAHTAEPPASMSIPEKMHWAIATPADQFVTTSPTNYRRWVNYSWYPVEEGGQGNAGEWTEADNQRLQALVTDAHQKGFWIRFYTLDGFAPGEDHGWGRYYNFGSRSAVELRWKAAIAAGVNFIATDQYEDLAPYMKQYARNLRPSPSGK
ncbi:hypothetical protein HNQ77_000614 [Silvibacterium bohemicum]|uniref:Uncharacterized protein n=1 Tax=Silvibacterium bohemicum TaxID=1577686 RepID=A0A841JMT9_9BACT|nr:hypothetical protein [Silvibacterium bohemicum]MBB6142676.1 hypothetical protein [Silvibacterium bohemicum]